MKVLSIDLDYVFDAVDDWPNEDNEMWDNWHPYSKWYFYFCKYSDIDKRENIVNEDNLDYLIETFVNALNANPNAKVCFGLDHDNILLDLEGDNIELVNIDHHDDFLAGSNVDGDKSDQMSEEEYLGGHILEYALIKAFNKVDEGNWGAKLHCDGRLKKMTWIRNPVHKLQDTRHFVNQFICNYMGNEPTEWVTTVREEYDHGNYEYDHIFICLSPKYLPYSQWDLLSLFMGIYEQNTGKDSAIEEWWDRRYIDKSQYKQVYEIAKEALSDFKENLT